MDRRTTPSKQAIADAAREAIETQIRALSLSREAIGDSFAEAVSMIASAPKTVTSGLGKSSFIARKMAATLASVRLPAVYLHPVDALHGDSGILEQDDVLVVFSKSGETAEVIRLVGLARELGMQVVAVTSRPSSTLAVEADSSVLALIDTELDPDNILPTASTTSALVMADLVALGALQLKGGAAERLRASHPDGAIGSALMRTIDDVMHAGDSLPIVSADASVGEGLVEMTAKGLGIVCICDASGHLRGILTDGDVRRLALKGADLTSMDIRDAMTTSPTTVGVENTLHEALQLMERRDQQIAVLPVVKNAVCVGVLRLHDIVRMNLNR